MKILLAAVVTALFACASRAEGGCPDGFVPQRGQGWQTCVPMVTGGARDDAVPGATRIVITRSFSAIAFADNAIFSFKLGYDSASAAAAEALAACRRGGGENCRVVSEFSNACGAVGHDDRNMYNAASETLDGAVAGIHRLCAEAHAGECHVYKAACSVR